VVAADLRQDWTRALVQSGHQPEAATVWLLEGITSYLTDSENDRLIDRVGALSSFGSELGLDLFNRERWKNLISTLCGDDAADPMAAMWQSSGREDPVEWLASHGWRGREHHVPELADRYGRPLADVLVRAGPSVMYNRFLTAHRTSM
jgi:methyltransferase (TIGR00027 family)